MVIFLGAAIVFIAGLLFIASSLVEKNSLFPGIAITALGIALIIGVNGIYNRYISLGLFSLVAIVILACGIYIIYTTIFDWPGSFCLDIFTVGALLAILGGLMFIESFSTFAADTPHDTATHAKITPDQ